MYLRNFMVRLPNVTLIAFTGKDFEAHKKAIDMSTQNIDFGAVKIIWDEKIKSIDDWNKKIIYELPKYVDTSHALLIHADGFVVNPTLWREEWLEYDFIGAPWPLPKDDYSYKTPSGKLIRVGNSISLRSKKLMDLVATRSMEYHYGNNNEDGQICVWERDWLESKGCKFAPLSVAINFSKEHEIPENKDVMTFAFHTL